MAKKDKEASPMPDKNLTDNELQEISLDPDTFKAIDTVVQNNPQFKDMTFTQLKESREFQQALKEYKVSNQSSKIDAQKLKSLKNLSSNLSKNTALITDKDLKHALTPYKNPYAYIQQLDEAFFQQLYNLQW